MKKNLETHINAVTVYSDRALVTRKGRIELTGEETELIIPDLPLSLETNSVRVAGRGAVAVRLLGVKTEKAFATQPSQENVRQLQEQIETLEQQKQTCLDRLHGLQLQHSFIQTLSEKSAERFSLFLAKQEVGLTETGALLDFVGDRYIHYATEIAQVKQQQQEIDKEIQVLRAQLQQVQNPPSNSSYRLITTIAPEAAGEFELEASYMVNRASWTPLYDLHLTSTSDVLHLSYLAEVQQRTGEDWSNVSLTLSTAKPALGSLPPKLPPWYIDILQPPIAPTAAPRMRKARAESEEAFASSDALEISAMDIPADVVTSMVEKTGSVVTFSASGGNDIPSDGTPHKVTLFRDEYSLSFQYVAIPKLVNFAYLQAQVTNPTTGVTLLPGEANIFRDGAFVGTTSLENIAPGQSFEIDLGIDEGLKLERDLVERQVDRKLIGSQRRITYAYRVTVENLLEETAILKLTEQLPVSRNEKIKVRLIQVSPEIGLGEMGRLEWSLNLSPHSQQEVYYQFVVEHPPDLKVMGLEDGNV